jgi:phage terminase small subunit
MAKNGELTDGQKQFIDEYLTNGCNAAKAYRMVYSHMPFSRRAACAMRKKPNVAAEIKRRMEEDAKNVDITVERTLQEIAKLAYGSDRDAIKLKALELLGKYLKLFVEKVEVDIRSTLAADLMAARERINFG